MPTTIKCDKKECANSEAPWSPVLLLYAPLKWGAGRPPIRIQLGLRLCDECKQAAAASDFLTDDGWRHLTRLILKSGYIMPDSNRTKLEFVKWEGSELQKQRSLN